MLAAFTSIDWAVLVAYLTLSTWLGARLAGKQATMRDFFLGGRKLPWYAVAGSSVATEISAVTFIGLPALVYAPGGDLTYLQLMLGVFIARAIIAAWFVPAFYEREIYSPYDFIGQRLGQPARALTTVLFVCGAVLGQSARVLLTALILEQVAGLPLAVSIWIIGGVAVLWTLLGGIAIVIWTDVIQFCVFVFALLLALACMLTQIDGGWTTVLQMAARATDPSGNPHDKLRMLNLSTDPTVAYTLWAAIIGNTLICLNAYGVDQMMAQRIFCCRSPREASRAILASNVGLGVAALAMMVGLSLHAFYQTHPLHPQDAAAVRERGDRIFTIFIIQELPPGLTGLVIAGVFAAAISSLDSVLAALSQTVITGLYQPLRARLRREPRTASLPAGKPAGQPGIGERSNDEPNSDEPGPDERGDVLLSKGLVVAWGAILCGMAFLADEARRAKYDDLFNLALAFASYTAGALLAAFLLALHPARRDYRGIVWSAPLSLLAVFALSWHATWAQYTTACVATGMTLLWIGAALRQPSGPRRRGDLLRGVWLALGCGAAVALCSTPLSAEPHTPPRFLTAAWTWNAALGVSVALIWALLLDRPQRMMPRHPSERRQVGGVDLQERWPSG